MDVQKTYLDHLRRLRPTQYQMLKQHGKLKAHAEQTEINYREAKQRYLKNGLPATEAMELASADWLEPMSEADEAEQAETLRESENQEAEFQAQRLVGHLQGYDPNKKGRQEWYLGDGRRVVRNGNREIVYPAGYQETSASTPPSSDKAEPSPNTATT